MEAVSCPLEVIRNGQSRFEPSSLLASGAKSVRETRWTGSELSKGNVCVSLQFSGLSPEWGGVSCQLWK